MKYRLEGAGCRSCTFQTAEGGKERVTHAPAPTPRSVVCSTGVPDARWHVCGARRTSRIPRSFHPFQLLTRTWNTTRSNTT